MSDEGLHPDALNVSAAPRRRRRRWPWIIGGAVLGLPALLLAAWTVIALSYT